MPSGNPVAVALMNFAKATVRDGLQIAISMAIYIHFFLPTQPVYTSSCTGHLYTNEIPECAELERKPQELRGVLLAYLREKFFFIATNGFLHSNERFSPKQRKVDW